MGLLAVAQKTRYEESFLFLAATIGALNSRLLCVTHTQSMYRAAAFTATQNLELSKAF